jgi:hypothetical protein
VRTLNVDLPQQINAEQTRLEVTLSPSLAGLWWMRCLTWPAILTAASSRR